jgi:large subunit ribosomal protein L4
MTTEVRKTAVKKTTAKRAVKKTASLSAMVYDSKGKEKGSVTLPENIFGVKWNGDLVHQVVTAIQANARITYAHTKDRSEVRGGGAKPWRQKGTGRARHGSRRSPIWAGGGITFGPRKEKDFSKKTTRKMRTKALFTILSRKLAEGELIFVDDIKTKEPSTKEASKVLETLGKIKGNESLTKKSTMLLLNERDVATTKSFRNLKGVHIEEARNMNPVNLLSYKYIIITNVDEVVKFLENKKK